MSLLGGQAMATMDGSILAIAAPSIRSDLHASGAELQLVVAMYTLAFAACVVTGARLGDILGRRRAFLHGLAGFTVASLVAGLAPTPATLIVARGCQGAAAALMTAQVLSIIQLQFDGEQRARAIGAYSAILAIGVAAGQIVGGVLVGADLMSAAWRPALLLNAPLGAVLLASARRTLPPMPPGDGRRLDVRGVGLLSVALLALIAPLSFGRDLGWPVWIWPCNAICGASTLAFVALERRLRTHGEDPLFDLTLLQIPGVGLGVLAVLIGMGCYAGFLLSLTLYLQDSLRFSPLQAGLTFAIYASGFAVASLTWTYAGAAKRDRLPVVGPLLMAGGISAIGFVTVAAGWRLALTLPLLFLAGVGHAWSFSPLTNRLTHLVQRAQAADLSGLILTADFVGMAIGAGSFLGIYLSTAPHDAARGFAITTGVIAGALVAATACARAALIPRSSPRASSSGWVRAADERIASR